MGSPPVQRCGAREFPQSGTLACDGLRLKGKPPFRAGALSPRQAGDEGLVARADVDRLLGGLQGSAGLAEGLGRLHERRRVGGVPRLQGREGRLGLALRAGHGGQVVVREADLLPEGSDAAPGHGRFVLGGGRRGDAGLGGTGPISTGPLSDERAGACESGRGQEVGQGDAAERGWKGVGFIGSLL